MSGHSKWNNIKNKKEKTDAQKGKVFTKSVRKFRYAFVTEAATRIPTASSVTSSQRQRLTTCRTITSNAL